MEKDCRIAMHGLALMDGGKKSREGSNSGLDVGAVSPILPWEIENPLCKTSL